MRLSLKAKLVAAFALMGLTVLFVGSLVYYLSFERLVLERFESELLEDAREFSETIVYRDGIAGVLDDYEWHDVDEEFVVATDARFQTIRKSANMGDVELQALYDFRPVSTPQAAFFNIDTMRLMCLVFPVRQDDAVVAYILIAASMEPVAEYIDILKESILIALLVLALFGVGLAYMLAGRMVRPVLSIQRAVDKVDLGSLDQRIELVQADTELKSLVETLNSLFARLEKSYHRINDFSSNVAHELQTPLTILRGNIEVALTREREREEYVEVLSDLLEETLHIIHIVDSLLLLARGDTSSLSIEKAPIDLGQFFEEHARDWEAVCSLKNQDLVVRFQEPYTLAGDGNLLAQLFLNLVSNASKFSDEGRPIEIDVQKTDGTLNGNGGVEITIQDRGIGIPEANQGKVFERFYRVGKDRSRETGGAGLGLSICEMIAKLHGGAINLTSKLGHGTSVTVALPLI